MRFKLLTLLLISFVLVIAAASMATSYFRHYAARQRAESRSELARELVQSFESVPSSIGDIQRIVDHAAASERSVMFIDIGWSITSKVGLRQFADFVVDFEHAHPNNIVKFHVVDGTSVTNGYAPFRSLPGWKELETNGQSLIHGNGEIVWMFRGKVVRVEPIGRFPKNSDLMLLTEQIFLLEHDQ